MHQLIKRRRRADLRRRIALDDVQKVKECLTALDQATLADADVTEAISRNSVKVLEEYVKERGTEEYLFDCDQLQTAVIHDSIAVLRWSVDLKAARHENIGWGGQEEWLEAAHHMCPLAARMGHTAMLEWMLTGKHRDLFSEAYPECCLCEEAAAYGRWETLRFLVEHGAQGVHCTQTRRYVTQALERSIEELARPQDAKNSRELILLRQDIQILFQDYEAKHEHRPNWQDQIAEDVADNL
ncbi:hypothetical protein CYMTET_47737 [Cymbomonas tetramitiformis]|uniref:Ankyrin repeat protein n=1 Tax=Cymbomonas tetramitiformis TaxID=36881 RepID=A0AAE0BTK6_9CHLO|nr:hypothetical protein CYMTET_47737 [Cymbomonas tetramitiformis]